MEARDFSRVSVHRCTKFIEDKLSKIKDNEKKEIYLFSIEYITLKTRVKTLTEVKNDLLVAE